MIVTCCRDDASVNLCRIILLCRRWLGSPLFASYSCSIVTSLPFHLTSPLLFQEHEVFQSAMLLLPRESICIMWVHHLLIYELLEIFHRHVRSFLSKLSQPFLGGHLFCEEAIVIAVVAQEVNEEVLESRIMCGGLFVCANTSLAGL